MNSGGATGQKQALEVQTGKEIQKVKEGTEVRNRHTKRNLTEGVGGVTGGHVLELTEGNNGQVWINEIKREVCTVELGQLTGRVKDEEAWGGMSPSAISQSANTAILDFNEPK